MADSGGSLHHLLKKQALDSLYAALDPKALILSEFPESEKTQFPQLSTESFIFVRGPRYEEYSDLRDKRLRKKILADRRTPEKEREEELQNRSILTPPKKQVKFSSNFTTPPKRPKGPSILTQSTPDFVSALRKENRKPIVPLPPVAEKLMTPPAGPTSKSGSVYGKVGGGSHSAEKRSGGLMARKSYASMKEFKGLAAGAAGNGISGENRGDMMGKGICKTVLRYRQF